MMLMIPAVYQGSEGAAAGDDFNPSPEIVERMMKFNEELAQAGVLISLDGLTPPSKAARVSFNQGNLIVTDGPFTESKEVLGGYWMIRANSRGEAIDWARRVPAEDGDIVEVRQVFEVMDFRECVQKVAENPIVQAAIEQNKAA